MIRYFLDLVVGIIAGFIPCFLVEIYYYPSICIMLLIFGVLVPCSILTIYSLFRYAVTKEKPNMELCMVGIIMGFIYESGIKYFICDYFLENQIFYNITGMEGFDMGEWIGYGMVLLGIRYTVPIFSGIFLWLIWRKDSKRAGREIKQKVEALSWAYCYPLMGYICANMAVPFIALHIVGGDKDRVNFPIIVVLSWLVYFLICLLTVLFIYLWGKGKNIPHMLAAYIGESVIFLLSIKIFSLPFPLKLLVALGGVIFLGAGIYKGLEKVFA